MTCYSPGSGHVPGSADEARCVLHGVSKRRDPVVALPAFEPTFGPAEAWGLEGLVGALVADVAYQPADWGESTVARHHYVFAIDTMPGLYLSLARGWSLAAAGSGPVRGSAVTLDRALVLCANPMNPEASTLDHVALGLEASESVHQDEAEALAHIMRWSLESIDEALADPAQAAEIAACAPRVRRYAIRHRRAVARSRVPASPPTEGIPVVVR